MGHYVLELIIVPLVGGMADWVQNVMDVAFLSPNTNEWLGVVEQPGTLRAFPGILAYTTLLVAAAIGVFQRRDVAGARGE